MLDKLSYYTSDEEMYLLRTVNKIKSHDKALTYREDKTLLDFFDKSLSNITKLNSAFVLDYLTAQIMCNKLSHDTMRTMYIGLLTELKVTTGDNHKVNNYLSTMKQIIVKCKVEIENMVDVNQSDKATDDYTDEVAVYSTQTSGNGYESRGGHKGNQGGHHNRHRGNKKPINLDTRGNLIWDYDGYPVDASKGTDRIFTLHTSSSESDRGNRGRGTPRGGRGSDRGSGPGRGAGRGLDQGYKSEPGNGKGLGRGNGSGRGADRGEQSGRGRGLDRGFGSGRRGEKGAQYDSKYKVENRYCMVCKG